MKTQNLILSFLVTLIVTANSYGQFTRQQAINLVLNNILTGDIENVDAYCAYNSNTGDVEMIDDVIVNNPYSESWVFFVNDNPFASWYHQSRYIFVNTFDGAYTIANGEIYPKSWKTDYEEVSLAERPDPIAMDGTAFVPDPQKVESNYNFALIVVSMDEYRNWYNTSLIYNVLLQNYNYQKDNIFVLYNYDGHSYLQGIEDGDLDGDGNNDDIDGPATWANIQSTIAQLTNDLGHGDQLAVFFTGVPVKNSVNGPYMAFHVDQYNIAKYPVSGLSVPIENIDCGQMILNFDVNSASDVSAYFEATGNPNALCKNRYLTGSTGSDEKNYAEMYFSGGNYSEQLFYWASAARGYLPDVFAQEPWNIWEEFGQLGLENGGGDYETYIPGHPGDFTLDVDEDRFIQMGEAFNYGTMLNTWTDDECYLPFYGEVPLVNPTETDEIPFIEDLITLAGLSGYIENDQTMPSRSYIMADTLYLNSNITLSFADNTEFYFNGSSSVVDPVFNLEFEPKNNRPRFICYENSNLFFGENSTIKNNYELVDLGVIIFYGHSIEIGEQSNVNYMQISAWPTIDHIDVVDISFKQSILYIMESNSFIEDCYVNRSFFMLRAKYVEVEDCIFDLSSVWADSYYVPHNYNYVLIDHCSFDGNYNEPYLYWCNFVLRISFFENFLVQNNKMFNNELSTGDYSLGLHYCGDGYVERKLFNNGIYDNYSDGIFIYSSNVTLDSNNVHDNEFIGLKVLNHSNVDLTGRAAAHYVHETQRIMDNGLYEVYSDDASFPVPFIWNAIIDEDNLPIDDELVYCEEPIYTEKIVMHNYWGENFNAEQDFFPAWAYIWEPEFELIYAEEEKSDAQILYETAQGKAETEDYTGAKNDFQQVVGQYPETRYAQAGLKELYTIEKYEANDYNTLKQYYLSDSAIILDSTLAKTGDFLANRCNLQLQNWQEAITWFENVIQYPPSFADSIYAIIDIGYTYMLMQQGGYKSSYVGSMPQYVPESYLEHIENSHYLLSLLPGDKKKKPLQENLDALKSGELLQNAPNPFSGTTQIWYKLDEDANISIKIFDYIGRCIKTFNQGTIDKGTHSISFSSEGLPSGVYFYTLEINSNLSDSKKMTILK